MNCIATTGCGMELLSGAYTGPIKYVEQPAHCMQPGRHRKGKIDQTQAAWRPLPAFR